MKKIRFPKKVSSLEKLHKEGYDSMIFFTNQIIHKKN
jgi:hypothetical protein